METLCIQYRPMIYANILILYQNRTLSTNEVHGTNIEISVHNSYLY